MTKVRKEKYASDNLVNQGYKVFFPHYFEWTKPTQRGRSRQVVKPYLPRYIFVGFTGRGNESIYTVNNTFGVATVVHSGIEPLAIPDIVISSLMEKADEDGRVVSAEKKPPKFGGKSGDQIKFIEGHPLFGLVATIKRVENRERIVVKLDQMLGQEREVSVHRADIGAVLPQRKVTNGPDQGVRNGGSLPHSMNKR